MSWNRTRSGLQHELPVSSPPLRLPIRICYHQGIYRCTKLYKRKHGGTITRSSIRFGNEQSITALRMGLSKAMGKSMGGGMGQAGTCIKLGLSSLCFYAQPVVRISARACSVRPINLLRSVAMKSSSRCLGLSRLVSGKWVKWRWIIVTDLTLVPECRRQ